MEFVSLRNLQYVFDDVDEKIDFKCCVIFVYEVVIVLEYIYENKIVYLDLKFVNVLIVNDGYCKFVDFGCCQIIEEWLNIFFRLYFIGIFVY